MEETGIVVKVTGKVATLRMSVSDACSACDQKSMCHPDSGTVRMLSAHDPIGVTPGDVVTVSLPSKGVWLAMGLVYGWPLVTLIAGAWLGFKWAVGEGMSADSAEIAAALSGLAGLGAGFVVLRMNRHRYEGRLALMPTIIRGR